MNENDIRPRELYEKLIGLAEQDIAEYFGSAARISVTCPACESKGEHVFEKQGFGYASCEYCGTLYVTPRPKVSAFNKYYREAESVKYWATTFYNKTRTARRKSIWKPRASKIFHMLKSYGASDHNIVDIGGGYGVFAEEVSTLTRATITVIEPSPDLAEVTRNLGFEVVEKFLEQVERVDLPDGPTAFVSFELFEHLHNPRNFLYRLTSLMSPGDFFIFSTLSSYGLDIQVLWDQSQSICPPFHLNFFNPRSVGLLLEKTGFDTLEVTTPGKLDIDILYNRREVIQEKFWKTFLHTADKAQRDLWQSTIAETGWSSHMLVMSSKTKEK